MEDLDDFDLAERAIRKWIDSCEGWDKEFTEESTKKRRRREEKVDCWPTACGQLIIRHPEVSDCHSAKGKLFRRRFQKKTFKSQRKSRIGIEDK